MATRPTSDIRHHGLPGGVASCRGVGVFFELQRYFHPRSRRKLPRSLREIPGFGADCSASRSAQTQEDMLFIAYFRRPRDLGIAHHENRRGISVAEWRQHLQHIGDSTIRDLRPRDLAVDAQFTLEIGGRQQLGCVERTAARRNPPLGPRPA